jgi:hypothetical protein
MDCCNNILPKELIDCQPDFNYNKKIVFPIEALPKDFRKPFKLLVKQYEIISFHMSGGEGYFDEDGDWLERFRYNGEFLTHSFNNCKIEYRDNTGNEFCWVFKPEYNLF